jgi:hypothetical protein
LMGYDVFDAMCSSQSLHVNSRPIVSTVNWVTDEAGTPRML